jgi:hypothetical protein
MKRPQGHWRYLGMLIALLVLFVVTPAVAGLRHGVLVVNAVAAAVFITGTYALRDRRRLFWVAVVLSAMSIIGTWHLSIRPSLPFVVINHACIIILILLLSASILGYVLRGRRITADTIFAAVIVYMLLAYAWTFAYALVAAVEPRSFAGLSAVAPNEYIGRVLQMRYFSFSTLTTVGYGDIVPRSNAARTLAELEAITGQIYLAVLVARLVGLHIVDSSGSRSREE